MASRRRLAPPKNQLLQNVRQAPGCATRPHRCRPASRVVAKILCSSCCCRLPQLLLSSYNLQHKGNLKTIPQKEVWNIQRRPPISLANCSFMA